MYDYIWYVHFCPLQYAPENDFQEKGLIVDAGILIQRMSFINQ